MDQPNAFIARLAGVAMLAFGILAAILAVVITERQLEFHGARMLKSPAVVMAIGFAIVAAFCSTVGYRLLLNRPNRYRSLLSPLGWRILAAIFVVVGLWVTVIGIQRGDHEVLVIFLPLGLLAYRCLIAGQAAADNADAVGPQHLAQRDR